MFCLVFVSHLAAITAKHNMKLRALGFCGADDSVKPEDLIDIAKSYPLVEFGVLFRPDKEGTPRYATRKWVEHLAACKPKEMLMAAHLCGSRVNDILDNKGDDFVAELQKWGFGRVQINATAVNGVDTSNLGGSVEAVAKLMLRFNSLEFIIQKNEETKALWQGLLDYFDDSLILPTNMSLLVDESKGTGVLSSSWPKATDYAFPIGYAGGIGPDNIDRVISEVQEAAGGESFWIDMESSLRSRETNGDGTDVFDLEKCRIVINKILL